jgi:predicted nuclease of predicted toxin-antitoxin system
VFPDITHVSLVGLDRASDDVVHAYARQHGCVIVTKDADFGDLGLVRGFPPKVVWLRLGNCTVGQIEAVLRANREAVLSLGADPGTNILSLY